MFGAIDAGLIMEVAKMNGYMHQLELDLQCPPWVFVNPEYLTDVPKGFDVYTKDRFSSIGSEDHPFFRDTRDWLEREGYIKCERSWHNGDRVLKPFYFNNVYMEPGEKFASAPAMGNGNTYKEFYNNGEPLPIPNYKTDVYSQLDGSW